MTVPISATNQTLSALRAELARTQRMMFALACVSAFQALVVLLVVILVIVRTR